MLNTPRSRRGMVTSPHHLASEAGVRVLREGGNAIEAAVAMAASLAVVYPHMTSIGGDGFWLISAKGRRPVAVDACGGAAKAATAEMYASLGHTAIPQRGPLGGGQLPEITIHEHFHGGQHRRQRRLEIVHDHFHQIVAQLLELFHFPRAFFERVRRRLELEQRTDASAEDQPVVRLGEKVVAARLDGFHAIGRVVQGRHEDHGDA